MGYLLTQNATIQCMHGGQAQPSVTNSHVKVDQQAIVTQDCSYTISACSYQVGQAKVPCVTAQWTSAAARVKAGGVPVLLSDSQATCTPNGTGVNIIMAQTRVKAL